MEKSLGEVLYIAVNLIVTSVMVATCYSFTAQARKSDIKGKEIKAFYNELGEHREWSRYEGTVTGADVADFIVRHKDMCDIVIWDSRLAANGKVSSYLTGGKLIMGLSDTKNIPDNFWDLTFIYDNILSGKGDMNYTAALLYDGQLILEYNGGVQVRGGVVTGVELVVG